MISTTNKDTTLPSLTNDPWRNQYPSAVPKHINLSLYKNIPEVFDEAVSKYAHKKSFSNFSTALTYSDLAKHVNQFASFLQHELKLKKGDRIAIQMPNVLQYPVVLFASLKIGLIVVNTNPLYTAYEMKHQFKDSGAKAIVILKNYAHLLEEIIKDTSIESVILTEIGDMLSFPKNIILNFIIKYIKKMVPSYHLPQAYDFLQTLEIGALNEVTPTDISQEDIAFLQYTGGTTGISKGAMLTHKNMIANMLQIANWMLPKLKEGEEITLTPLPMYHIFSLTVNCLSFMRYGAENILITNPKDIPSFIKLMRSSHFTLLSGVNTLFNALMNHPDFEKINFSKLKIAVAGGMALQNAVCEKWQRLTKSKLVEGYGLTESSPVACCNPIDGTDRTGTIGLPLPDTWIKLIDEDGNEVREAGEVCIKGPQVMKGYWQRPDETDKVLDNNFWLKTGDIGSYDEKYFIKIIDRKKDMILVSGFNVYPNEVEDALASHPGILEVAAIGEPSETSGEVVKVVIVKKDPNLTEQEVIDHAKTKLTNYKIPKIVEFRSELPKTNIGKILRRALRSKKA